MLQYQPCGTDSFGGGTQLSRGIPRHNDRCVTVLATFWGPVLMSFSQDSPLSRSHKLSIVPHPGVGICVHLPSLCWDSVYLVHSVTTTFVSSYVQLFSCVQKIISLSHLPPLSLTIFLAPLWRGSLSFGRRDCNINVPFRAEHFTVPYFLYLDQK